MRASMTRCCYMMFLIPASLSMSSKSSRLSRPVCSKVMSWNMKLKVNSLTISNIHFCPLTLKLIGEVRVEPGLTSVWAGDDSKPHKLLLLRKHRQGNRIE